MTSTVFVAVVLVWVAAKLHRTQMERDKALRAQAAAEAKSASLLARNDMLSGLVAGEDL